MNTTLKKLLIILVIVLVVALIGFLVYNFIIKKPAEDGGNGTGGLPEGEGSGGGGTPPNGENGEEPAPESKIKAISQEKVLSPTLSSDKTRVMYYSQINGNVWESAFDGSELTRISSTNLDNLFDIIWSPDKKKVISIYQDESGNINKYLYDSETKKATPLSSFMQEIVWSDKSDKVLYQFTNDADGGNNISFANPDGTKWQNVFQTRMKNLNLDWLAPEISFYEKPSGIAQGSLFLYNSSTKNLTKILTDIYGLSALWSPQKDKVLFSKTNDSGKNIGLYVVPKTGLNEKNLTLATLVEKCVWALDNRNIFCAVPNNIQEANILPDDFYKGAFLSNDEFWKINIDTGEKTLLLEDWEKDANTYDATKLFLSPLENYLFFVNKKDGLLYSIEL